MSKDELIELVKKIKECRGTEDEIDQMILLLEKNVPHPQVSDLIFFDNKSPSEIVDMALNYKSINL